MEAKNEAAEALTAEYLRLRCDILDQFDADMFTRGLSAGAAYGRAEEAFAEALAARPEWTRAILLAILARRDPAAAARPASDASGLTEWTSSPAFFALPPTVQEWLHRDLRRLSAVGLKA